MADKEEIEGQETEEVDELGRIEAALKGSAFDEPAIRRLIQENPDGATEAILSFVKTRDDATAQMVARERRRDMDGYRDKLAKEFPGADPDAISGTSKKEMRRSAEKAHKHIESMFKAAGVTPAWEKKPGDEKKPEGAEERGKEWVQAPAGATEVTREAPAVSPDQLRSLALSVSGPDAEAKLAAFKAAQKGNGPRIITRPNIASALARRTQEPAKT